MSRFTSAFLLCLHTALICGLVPANQFTGKPSAERFTHSLTVSSHRQFLERPEVQPDKGQDGYDAPPDITLSLAAIAVSCSGSANDETLNVPPEQTIPYPDFQGRAPPTRLV